MKPKKYMIALDPTTKTYENFSHSDYGVLQILSEDCKKYVNIFGKNTGFQKDKLKGRDTQLILYQDFPVLKKAASYLYVKKADFFPVPGGDHDMFVVDVISWKYQNPSGDFLTTESIF